MLELAAGRLYTGPWFTPINFWLRFGPVVHTCDPEPYHTHHSPRRLFQAGANGLCRGCGKTREKKTGPLPATPADRTSGWWLGSR